MYYSKIDYLVVPSISDGFAQVVQEALSMSVPVICSNAVGASEYLDKNLGHIFQSKSTEELTKILDNLNEQDLNDKISNIYKHYITFENKIKSDQKKIINLLKTIN
jgi:glycosyltransferase involved in cell wall biosynthesis